jgi:hypothetical protein
MTPGALLSLRSSAEQAALFDEADSADERVTSLTGSPGDGSDVSRRLCVVDPLHQVLRSAVCAERQNG